jgi:hypothetical protein
MSVLFLFAFDSPLLLRGVRRVASVDEGQSPVAINYKKREGEMRFARFLRPGLLSFSFYGGKTKPA